MKHISKLTFKSFKNGNNDLISKIYLEYKNLVYFVAANYISNKNDVEDIVSEVFLKFIQHKHEINDVYKIKSYLCSLTKNESLNFLKKNFRNYTTESIDQLYGENDRNNELLNDIEKHLTNKETIILYYRAVFEYSWSEIENITGIPESTSRRIYTHIKDKLRKELIWTLKKELKN